MINGLLKLAHFIENRHEAAAERSQPILYLDRRLLTEDRALHDTEAGHFAQPLVHHLRGQARASPKERAGTAVTVGAKLEQAKRPLAPDDALDHQGNGDGGRIHRLALSTD